MMIFVNGWRLKNKLSGHSKKLWTIFNILAQLLTNRNNNNTGSNHNEGEHNDDERPKTEKLKESSSIDAEVIKGI